MKNSGIRKGRDNLVFGNHPEEPGELEEPGESEEPGDPRDQGEPEEPGSQGGPGNPERKGFFVCFF